MLNLMISKQSQPVGGGNQLWNPPDSMTVKAQCDVKERSKILSEASGQGRNSFKLHAADQQPLDQRTADQAVTEKSGKMAQYGNNERSLSPLV